MGSTTLRDATNEDLEHLILLGWEMHQESRFKNMEYSPERVANFLVMNISDPDFLICVAEKNGEIVGGFIGCVIQQWFSEDLTAADFALFLHPDHRGGMIAARLANRYVYWALEKGVKPEYIQLGISTGVMVEETTKLYEYLRFEKTGALFHYMGAA